jgi:CheY-like chemotaxis protein
MGILTESIGRYGFPREDSQTIRNNEVNQMADILISDDDENVRILLRRTLQAEGYHTEEAKNGSEAIKLFRSGAFDLVITDLHMPGMHGIDLIYQIRELFPKLPIIAISGGSTGDDFIAASEDLRTAASEGANLIIPKPCDMDYLLEKVELLLTGTSPS